MRAVWTLTGSVDTPRSTSDVPFPAETYSRFKHGDATSCAELADALFERLIDDHPHLLTDETAPIFPVAYLNVPPACYFLASDVADRLDEMRMRNGFFEPCRIVRILKDSVTTSHYAGASRAVREAELNAITFTLNEPVDPRATYVLLDDITVTGLAEEHGVRALRAAGVSDDHLIVGYLARVDDSLSSHPEVEAVINHAAVTSITDMIDAINAGTFYLTIRFVKDVLGADAQTRTRFAAAIPSVRVEQIIDAAHLSGQTFVDQYQDALKELSAFVGED